ncbi:MAG: 30S ribosomal protein S20 [Candidatus Pacebacteria bacterium]|nr:30S ribosomal protein S20 [Candidatus Paceibacterota bacterium]
MPNTKSAKKELRKNTKLKASNDKVKQTFKKSLKETRKSLETAGKEKSQELIKKTIKSLDKAAKKGVIKKNTASRYKSRLQKKANASK